MNELLVSIIIPTCKREPAVLKEAIDSVINQTYKNIEIIIVNDAPDYKKRDQIISLVNTYEESVNYIENEDSKGANYSRNKGAALSHGEVLSFLDDDDFWHQERIEKVIKAINSGYDIVYSDMFIFTNKNKKYSKSMNPLDSEKYSRILSNNYLRGFSNVSFTKKIFEESGRLDETVVAYQDLDLFIRMVPLGRICYIPEPLTYYRISETSISSNREKKFIGLMHILNEYQDIYEKYPDSKRIKLENDYINALRNGWYDTANKIRKILLPIIGYSKLFRIHIKGISKYFVLNAIRIIKEGNR